MAKKNQEFGKGGYGKQRSVKNPSNVKRANGFSPGGELICESPVRMPSSANSSQGSSPRTSPGLLAGHYAGCKWNEPPLPSALPLPPQHWMMQTSLSVLHPHRFVKGSVQQPDIAQQLKVLLKVQA